MAPREETVFVTSDWSPWILASGLFPLAILWLGADYVLKLGWMGLAISLPWILLFLLTILRPLVAKLRVEERGFAMTVLGLRTLKIAWRDVKEVRVKRFYISFHTKRFLPIVVYPADRTGFLEAVRVAKPDLPILQR